MMVGLPNAGKSNWVRKYMDSHPEKLYNVIGVSHVLERCMVSFKDFYCVKFTLLISALRMSTDFNIFKFDSAFRYT